MGAIRPSQLQCNPLFHVCISWDTDIPVARASSNVENISITFTKIDLLFHNHTLLESENVTY